MNQQLTESSIVRGLQDGQSDSWAALCELYGDRVWKYVARLIGNDEATVADVVQETFLAVADSGRNLQDDSNLWGWLSTIAHRQTALYWRKHYREAKRSASSDTTRLAANHDPADGLMQREQTEQVRRFLAEMPAIDATVLIAKYMDGLSVQQIVEANGGTVESVRSRIARARRLFKERFPIIEKCDREVQSD